MKENTEERRKRKLDDEDCVSAQTVQVPNGRLSLHRSSHVPIVVLRANHEEAKSLWRITTTKTVEGLLSENPSNKSKKKMEELHEMSQIIEGL